MLPRHLTPAVQRALRRSPVVLLTGSRQVGKSTLVQALARAAWRGAYATLDDRATLDAALHDPDAFLEANPAPLAVDEVQRAPDLLRAVKRVVDRDRRPGRYLLTGSANLLTLKSVSERLSGRVALFNLEPFSWTELERRAAPRTLEPLLAAPDAPAALRVLGRRSTPARRSAIQHRILAGGFPIPSRMTSARDRREWFAGYRATYLERDVRELAALEHAPAFSRLLSLLALRSGQLMNFTNLSGEAGLAMMTLRRYTALLEATYQLFFLQPYAARPAKRLVRTPKVYLSDSGLCCHLSGVDDWVALERQGRVGALVETWFVCELRRLLGSAPSGISPYFWRDHAGHEVDVVLEGRGRRVAGIEVKWSSTVGRGDLSGLAAMRRDLGPRMGLGIVAYGGTEIVGFDRVTLAVPFSVLVGPDAPAR